jgi:hypothetical protein
MQTFLVGPMAMACDDPQRHHWIVLEAEAAKRAI